MTIYAISDLHTDNKENRELIESLSKTNFKKDSLIVAGDISNNLTVIERTLQLLLDRFKHVFFTPGNHEFWVAKDDQNSLGKFDQIISLCTDLGIHWQPKIIEGAWVIPLFSWYEKRFFPAGDDRAKELDGWGDYHLCKWPGDEENQASSTNFNPCDHFIDLNRQYIRPYNKPIISFTHFVPRLELIPPQKLLFFKSLPMVSGSTKIEEMVRTLGSKVHVFGHTHINVDRNIDGVRYLQNALRYPRERKMFGRPNVLKLEQVWPLIQKDDDVPWQKFL
ncbi:MAG: metallophosphoesterase [Anaerolineae bacterium]